MLPAKPQRRRRLLFSVASVAALLITLASPSAASAGGNGKGDAGFDQDLRPYLGWSSWSLQATRYPRVNTQGNYSWLNEENLLEQVDAMASKLKKYGYEYINIDAGWWMDWDWNMSYDQYGRQRVNTERFPHGMQYIADYIHRKGLKMGIYMPVGLERGAYGAGTTPIWGTRNCTTSDIVYDDLRGTNGFGPEGSAYAMDFSNPCSRKYIDSLVAMFDKWGVDLLKLDGVGPGSGKDPEVNGDNFNNVADVAAWDRSLAGTKRHIHLLVSWSVDHDYVTDWQKYADSWRVGWDVECYCSTMTTWFSSSGSIRSVLNWVGDSGPTNGWNNLDSLNVGVGEMDGLTDDERRTIFTFWAMAASPLYIGDDLTKLDSFGLSLLTNREVVGINQLGIAAQPLDTSTDQEVWYIKRKDGSYVVGLYNFGSQAAHVQVNWSDLGLRGSAKVRDVWADMKLGNLSGAYTATVPSHGVQLLTVEPTGHR